MPVSTKATVKEDTWIPTSCGQCYCMYGVKARRQDGVITDAATGRAQIVLDAADLTPVATDHIVQWVYVITRLHGGVRVERRQRLAVLAHRRAEHVHVRVD